MEVLGDFSPTLEMTVEKMCYFDYFLFSVISTKRSAWRNLQPPKVSLARYAPFRSFHSLQLV